MIVLLSCSMNSLGSNYQYNSSTGGLKQDSLRTDSVLIAYSDLRKVNAKLIELDYEKEINRNLRSIISNDSLVISAYDTRIAKINADYQKRIKKIKKQRNVIAGAGIVSVILLIISLL